MKRDSVSIAGYCNYFYVSQHFNNALLIIKTIWHYREKLQIQCILRLHCKPQQSTKKFKIGNHRKRCEMKQPSGNLYNNKWSSIIQCPQKPKPKNVHTFLTALMTLGSLNPESLQQRATVTVGGILRSSLNFTTFN